MLFSQASSALVVGCGGLGCPAAAYLAGAGSYAKKTNASTFYSVNSKMFALNVGDSGVGRIGLIDHDTVEVSNLHRQVLHLQSRVGVSKAVSLAASLAGINPSVEVKPSI